MAVKLEINREDIKILEQDLAPGQYIIGSDLGCDIVLPDLEEPIMAVVQAQENQGKFSTSLTSQVEGLIANNENLPTGQSLENQKLIKFSYASYAFSLKSSGKTQARITEATTQKSSSGMSKLLLLFALLFALAAVATQVLFSIMPKEKTVAIQMPVNMTEEEKAQNLYTFLQKRIVNADLTEKVKLANAGAKIVASGRLTEIEMIRWREISTALSSLDKSYLTNSVDIEPFGDDLISGYGWIPQPYVITKKGERYKEGDKLPSGWSIELISRKSVKVRRDELTFEIGLP